MTKVNIGESIYLLSPFTVAVKHEELFVCSLSCSLLCLRHLGAGGLVTSKDWPW